MVAELASLELTVPEIVVSELILLGLIALEINIPESTVTGINVSVLAVSVMAVPGVIAGQAPGIKLVSSITSPVEAITFAVRPGTKPNASEAVAAFMEF